VDALCILFVAGTFVSSDVETLGHAALDSDRTQPWIILRAPTALSSVMGYEQVRTVLTSSSISYGQWYGMVLLLLVWIVVVLGSRQRTRTQFLCE
jgi:hypothetical protein